MSCDAAAPYNTGLRYIMYFPDPNPCSLSSYDRILVWHLLRRSHFSYICFSSKLNMKSAIDTQDFSHLEAVLGSLPMIKRYIVICLAFPLEDTISISQLQTTITGALTKLATAFPFLAGQVIYEGRDDSHSGLAKMVPLGDRIRLVFNDLRHNAEFASMADMIKAKFPFSLLDPDILIPPIAVSWATEGFEKTAPVLILQANIVRGGMLLTFSGNHTQMDMTALGTIISLFSKACRDEPYTDKEIAQGNQSRRNAVPLLGSDFQPGDELNDAWARPSNQTQLAAVQASVPRWAYFNFRAKDLIRLKGEASRQSIVPYISTDDAIGALCWQRVTKARASILGPQATTTFCRPISARKYLSLEGYLGHMVDCTYEDAVDVYDLPLGDVTGRLRKMLLQEEKIKRHMQAFATELDRLDDKSKLLNGAKLNPMRDVVVSSYANIKCCELSFGPLLGRPEAARRPRMPPWPSLFYLMPKAINGDIAVAFCVGEEDLAWLRNDVLLRKYAEYLG